MKKKLNSALALALTGVMLLSACDKTAPNPSEESQTAPVATEESQDVSGETDELPLVIEEEFDGTTDYWQTKGDCTVTLDGGMAVITDRQTGNSGLEIPCDHFRGNTITATATCSSENDSVMITLKYDIYGNTSYVNIATMATGGSMLGTVSGSVSIPANASSAAVYIESTDLKDITVDRMVVEIEGEFNDLTNEPPAELQDPSGYDSLKDLYSDYFKIGTCLPMSVIDNPNPEFLALVDTEFNSVTPENELKPESILDAATTLADPAAYNECPALDFSNAIPILEYCQENNIPMRGHTLIWYSQTPSWLFYENYDVNGELADRELMLTRMENYIDSVMNWCEENYPGVIYAWDVVNEAADDNGGGLRDCYWRQTIGDDYVEKAFEYARLHAPDGVQLFYNDYNEYFTTKQDEILEILAPVAAAGNIDGVGMQSHISNMVQPESYIEAMNRYVDELGVVIHITELDVNAPLSPNSLYDQGVYMQSLFEAIIEAKDNGTPIECVTFWGLTDDMSWRSSNQPLLFFGNIEPKPAFEGVVCAITGGEITIPDDYVEVESDFSAITEDYENEEFIGGPRYSASQSIVGDAYEGDYCLENTGGTAEYDGYAIDITRFSGQTIHFSFAVRSDADQVSFTADIEGSWPHLIEVDTTGGEWVYVEGDYEVPSGMPQLNAYWESSDMSPFYLDNVSIEVAE
ncbi:endo-1,4-beta-xylanase [Ruminococcaceae bacterium KH2T8]|nr:endo-1,4-beta-xylanase [Ruminococcaceae bacterium KH2T8]